MDSDLSWEILGSATRKFGFTQRSKLVIQTQRYTLGRGKIWRAIELNMKKNKEGRYAESSINAAIN